MTGGMLRRRLVVALATCTMLAGAGCGSDAPTATERPLTSDESALLANALFQNLERGGAAFQLAVQVGDAATINLQGEVDWSEHRGYAQVSTRNVEPGIREVFWSDDAVLEARDDLDELLRQAGLAAAPWVVRDPDPEGRQLDQALALVTGLAAAQRDNPLLIEQEPGSAFLRSDTLRGVDVVVLRYGRTATYWLARDDGRMLRFESDNSSKTRPVVFDVVDFREVTIDGPPVSQITDVADLGDLYDAALSG
jgi:hypothetical protein